MQTLTKTLTGAQIIIQTLKQMGVDTVFGYPGGVVLEIYDELSKQSDIKHYLVRHEQAAVHAAEGYARVTGKCGVVLVTSGPGATNTITGIANAYHDGFPLVVITGQVPAKLLHQNAFQEVDIISMTKACTKKNFQVKDINDLQSTLNAAFKIALSVKQGPVLVDITKNVFSQNCELENISADFTHKSISCADIDSALNLINNSKKPVIIAGGGAINASDELQKFADIMGIPVVSTMMGLGIYPANGKNYAGMIGIFGSANEFVRESDLIFAIGTKLNDRIMCKLGEISQKFIRLDINPKELAKNSSTDIELLGDSKEILSKMIAKCSPKPFVKRTLLPVFQQKRTQRMHSFEVMQEIQNCISDKNLVITTEVGQHQVWTARYLRFNHPRKFITSGGLGTMGFGFPAAIGASIANNRKPVICIAGDGSFQMNMQEIATCMDYNLPVKVFIMNNGYLGMVRQFQEKSCDKRYFATKISNPDFVKLAESYGATGLRVEKPQDIKPAIEKALSIDSAVIVDFVIEPEEIL